MEGRPIRVRLQPALVAYRGKLYSGKAAGEPVHAGTDIRRREIVLDLALRRRPRELARILIHEVFHFAWVRLGNVRRASYAALVGGELRRGARGELGWSAEYRKLALLAQDPANGPKGREYVCESFCDTAAWRYSNIRKHNEFTLSHRHRVARERWFAEAFGEAAVRV